jgi:hypothetical protein
VNDRPPTVSDVTRRQLLRDIAQESGAKMRKDKERFFICSALFWAPAVRTSPEVQAGKIFAPLQGLEDSVWGFSLGLEFGHLQKVTSGNLRPEERAPDRTS